jgi:hypothetical protein
MKYSDKRSFKFNSEVVVLRSKCIRAVLYICGALLFYALLFGAVFPFINRLLLSIPLVRQYPYISALLDSFGNSELSIGLWVGLGYTRLQALGISALVGTLMAVAWFLLMKKGAEWGVRRFLGKRLAEQFDPEHYRSHWLVRWLGNFQRSSFALFLAGCFPVAFLAAMAAVILFRTRHGFLIILAGNLCKITFFALVYWPHWGMRIFS